MLLLLDALYLGRQTFRGPSTTPRSGHPRPHGRVIYDPTVGSSTTPRSGRLSLNISKFTQLLPFPRTMELPFVVITYNSPQYYVKNDVELLTSRVFSSIVRSYVTQRQGVARRYCNRQYYFVSVYNTTTVLRSDNRRSSLAIFFISAFCHPK